MAHSRLERIGTIYSRITGLIRTGAMKLEDRPLWYEIYETFPPKVSPQYDRKIEDTPVTPIFYPEDKIRALFYKRMVNSLIGNLSDSKQLTLCQKCIQLTKEIEQENKLDLENSFDSAFSILVNEINENKSKTSLTKPSSATQEESLSTPVSIKDIFKG